jgi:hypothetical protein
MIVDAIMKFVSVVQKDIIKHPTKIIIILIKIIYSWAGGTNPWGPGKEGRFTKPSHHDKKLEIIGLTGTC